MTAMDASRALPSQRDTGVPDLRVAPAIDVTDMHRRLVDSLDQYAVFLLDPAGIVRTWNHGAQLLTGYDEAEIVGHHFSTFYVPEAVATGHPDRVLEVAEATGSCEELGWRVRRDGSRLWARVVVVALRDDDGTLRGFGEIATDVTAYKESEDQLRGALGLMEQTARIDQLTGLPNRRALEESLAIALAAARRSSRGLTLAIIDLDYFKQVNDEHGHPAGDSLLRQAAFAWRRCLRPSDVLARYGGEEFVVVMADTDFVEGLSALERLRRATPADQTCSIGVAQWDFDETAATLVQRADHALYLAKAGGRDRLVCAETASVVLPQTP